MIFFLVALLCFALALWSWGHTARERRRLEGLRPCPFCTTLIPAVARVCRTCLRDVPPAPPLVRVPSPHAKQCPWCGRWMPRENASCWWCCREQPATAGD